MTRSVTGATALENLIGLAPGILVISDRCTIIALPGIPKEMKPMFKQYVLPLVEENTKKKSAALSLILHMSLLDFFQIISELRETFPEAYIKRHARPPNRGRGHHELEPLGIDIVVWRDTVQACEARIGEIKDKLSELVQGRQGKISENP
jgi:molybdopterin-biosynthesis enzyme MoeA-like protein